MSKDFPPIQIQIPPHGTAMADPDDDLPPIPSKFAALRDSFGEQIDSYEESDDNFEFKDDDDLHMDSGLELLEAYANYPLEEKSPEL